MTGMNVIEDAAGRGVGSMDFRGRIMASTTVKYDVAYGDVSPG